MNKVNVLDHGYVRLLNIAGAIPRTMFADEDIPCSAKDTDPATCARISFDNFNEVRTEEQDMKLVEYLISNGHTTPLEMTTIWMELKIPIFVARQFHRHRTQSISEVSGRYTTLPEEWYIPEVVGGKSTNGAKQGQEDNLDLATQEWFKDRLNSSCADSYREYIKSISLGIAPEHARLFLHLNHYTHYIFKMDLHNMMNFLRLRLHNHAQVEARVYAQAMYDLLAMYLPKTMELFNKYRRN